jgi:hypothetical protein
MTNSVPSADTLLQAAARYLEEELLPTLDGYHRFQTRVSVNVLRMVQRELLREGSDIDEAARAARLELADAIRDGRLPIDSPGLAAQLRAELGEALAINNPRWATPNVQPRTE